MRLKKTLTTMNNAIQVPALKKNKNVFLCLQFGPERWGVKRCILAWQLFHTDPACSRTRCWYLYLYSQQQQQALWGPRQSPREKESRHEKWSECARLPVPGLNAELFVFFPFLLLFFEVCWKQRSVCARRRAVSQPNRFQPAANFSFSRPRSLPFDWSLAHVKALTDVKEKAERPLLTCLRQSEHTYIHTKKKHTSLLASVLPLRKKRF